ncbi:MAG: phosphoglycerate kinase [Bacilli bacterium]|nr:phosphoglycerate kinase [Bacilli bacterium]
MKTIKDMNLDNKKVLIRCDFNVPIKDGQIIDDTRIRNSLETIKYALKQNAKIILLSHLGRIKTEEDLEKNNLEIVAHRLSELLNKEIIFINETRGKNLENKIGNMNPQDIILIQNTRYEDLNGKKESSNNKELATYWASLGDIFINDAFGTIHRSHASNVGISQILPSAIGILVEKELKALSILNNPDRPFTVILGGAKVEDKIGVIKKLSEKADYILIGGGMAYTFLKSKGYKTGASIIDENSLEFCKDILNKYEEKIILPIDLETTKEFKNEEKTSRDINNIKENEMGLDIGEKTIKLFNSYINKSKLVVWNGPLGVYEFENFKIGTNKVLHNIVEKNIKAIIGGGDIVAAVQTAGLKEKIFHVSTGGGATLEYLEGKKLPGLESIK